MGRIEGRQKRRPLGPNYGSIPWLKRRRKLKEAFERGKEAYMEIRYYKQWIPVILVISLCTTHLVDVEMRSSLVILLSIGWIIASNWEISIVYVVLCARRNTSYAFYPRSLYFPSANI